MNKDPLITVSILIWLSYWADIIWLVGPKRWLLNTSSYLLEAI